MSLRIIKPGISTTLQDAGRPGFQSAGVPASGAMDTDSMRMANILCGNEPGSVVLETTLHGAEWLVEEEQLIAFSGSGASILINNLPAPYNRAIRVKACSLLSLKPTQAGCRSYLAVSGGFKAMADLNSHSTYIPAGLGGYHGRALQAGDLLEWHFEKSILSAAIMDSLAHEGNDFTIAKWGIDFDRKNPGNENAIRIFNGPEWNWFDEHIRSKIYRESFGVSNQSNRMGYRLSGPAFILSEKRELISTSVCSGIIQVTHEGSLVLLMADAQTTGGYPRLAMVAAVDLPACAQLRPGDSIQFSEIFIDDAEALLLQKEKILRQIEKSIAIKFLH